MTEVTVGSARIVSRIPSRVAGSTEASRRTLMPLFKISQPPLTTKKAMRRAAALSRGRPNLWPIRAKRTRDSVRASALNWVPSATRPGELAASPALTS